MPDLSISRIALHTRDLHARVEALGRLRTWEKDAYLCRAGEIARTLHVIVDGHVRFEGGAFGPGAHAGEIGFLLGVARTADVIADGPVTTWSVEFDACGRDPAAATLLVSALALELPSRIRKLRPPPAPDRDFCNAEHPAIHALARSLTGATHEETARTIWSFVRAMPYRFGIWWQRASDTLRQGWGMCTTKSNLQVALMRAAGIESGFIEISADSAIIRPIIPDAWQHAIKPGMKHFLAAVRLDGRWHAADASFTDAILEHFGTRFHAVRGMSREHLSIGHPFHPAARATGADPFDVTVLPSLDRAMARRSSHDIDRLEVMNALVDRLQGPVVELPATLARAQALMPHQPVESFYLALSTAATLAEDLRRNILEPA